MTRDSATPPKHKLNNHPRVITSLQEEERAGLRKEGKRKKDPDFSSSSPEINYTPTLSRLHTYTKSFAHSLAIFAHASSASVPHVVMDGLLRTLTRSRNNAPSPSRGSRNRSRYGDKRNGGGGGENHHSQIEVILEALARGLVEYAVQKYMKKLSGGGDDKDGRHHSDRRLSARGNGNHDSDERARGGVPNMDTEMLEHLGKNILSKAMDRFGGGGGADEEDGRGRERAYSQDRYAHSRERSQDRYHRRSHRNDGGSGGGSGSKDEDRERRRRHSPRDGYSSPSRHHRGGGGGDDDDDGGYRRRRRHGTDYAPLVESLETLSNTIVSLNERQPGHADCQFYEAFAERSGKTQAAIGAVLAQLREREERRQERRGRRRS